MISLFSSSNGSKWLLRFFLGFVLPVSLVIIVFLTVPKIRHGTFSVAQRLPGAVTYFFLNLYVPGRYFEKAIPWLDRQLNLAIRFSPSQNTLLPDLIKNTAYVFQRARFREEMAVMSPFLERLVKSFPEVFLARVWLAKSIAPFEPSSALGHLEESIKLVSVDDRPYRIALSIALRENWPDRFQDWCERYQKAQFGGHHYLTYNTLFGGLGLRAMTLEIDDGKEGRELITNKGIQLGNYQDYDFHLKNPTEISSLRLHFGVVPGVLARINQIRFYRGGGLTTQEKDMILMSWSGYHMKNGDILLASLDGEVVDLYPPRGNLAEVDHVQINIRFERAGLGKPFPCGKRPQN